jgi:hypothetical protein
VTEAQRLRLQAAQCRRLARAVNGPRDVALLEILAGDYEAAAARLETAPAPLDGTTPMEPAMRAVALSR